MMDAIVKSITAEEVEELKAKGHIIVICGNGGVGNNFRISASPEIIEKMDKEVCGVSISERLNIKIEEILIDMREIIPEDKPIKNYKKTKFFQ